MLLDLKLPKVDGLEALKQIKSEKKLRMMPVVVLTSSKEEKDMMASYKLGVSAYVVKPVDFHEFVNAIKELGVFWAVMRNSWCKIGVGCVLDKRKRRGDSEALPTAEQCRLSGRGRRSCRWEFLFASILRCPLESACSSLPVRIRSRVAHKLEVREEPYERPY